MNINRNRWMKKVIAICCMTALLFGNSIWVKADTAEQEESTRFVVSIVHTNDIHGRVKTDESNQVLGLARVKTYVEQRRTAADGVILLDAGGFFDGQSIAAIDQGESVAKLMGSCGYDAMAAGNHDWNYGKDRLKGLEQIVRANGVSDFSILAGNVSKSADRIDFFDEEFLVREFVKDDKKLKVGVFGVIDPAVYSATVSANVEGLQFSDMAEYADYAVTELRQQGCQIIVGIAHCIAPARLAASVNGVDLWVAGHEHSVVNERVATPNGDSTLVVEAGYHLGAIGDVNLTCNMKADGFLETINLEERLISYEDGAKLEENAVVSEVLKQTETAQEPLLAKKAGTAPQDLKYTWEKVRIGETTLTRAVTSGYLLATGADVALEKAGSMNAGITAGDVTYKDVVKVLPYGSYVVTKSLTGAQLLSVMEKSLDIMQSNVEANASGKSGAWSSDSGEVIHVAGMEITYNVSGEKGNRISKAVVGGQEIKSGNSYVVAMNSDLAADKTHYPEIAGKNAISEYGTCEDIFAAYLNQKAAVIVNDIGTPRLIAKGGSGGQKDDKTENNGGSSENIKAATGFSALCAMAKKTTKKSVQLRWSRVKGADGYIVYGGVYGKGKSAKLAQIKSSVVKYTHNKRKKGTCYKYVVKAYRNLNGKQRIIAVSKEIYVVTDGGKFGNAKAVKVSKTKISLKKGKTVRVKASVPKQGKKIKTYRKICFETDNAAVATVSRKGVIRAKKKGTCNVYVYAQNGVYKKVKVKVK